MSATLTDRAVAAGSAERNAPSAARIALDAGILAVLLCLVVTFTDGWFTADEVVMNQQSSLLVTEGRWTTSPDPGADAIDPDRLFPLLARADRIGTDIAPYTKHPVAPAVVAFGEALGGRSGRHVPGALAVLGASMLLASRFEWSRLAFWFLALATTAVFHVSVVWAHAPALFFATAAAVLLFPPRRAPTTTEVVLASTAVAATALFRSEGLLLGAGLSASMFLVPLGSSGRRRIMAVGPILAAVVVYVGEPLARTAAFGTASAPLAVPATDSSGWQSRLEVVRIMLLEPSVAGGLGALRLFGALALVIASVGLATRRLEVRQASVLLIGAVCCYLAGVLSTPIPGLLVAMPLITASVPWIVAPRRHETGAIVAAAVFACGVIVTSYDNAGGGDWGARYLFIGVPLLALALVPALERMLSEDAAWSSPRQPLVH
ncbi:MAG: hypothetical protein KJN63_10670 [Acidimicrobiia bacterium]|nr:hypothetical protein [Acidimicrobiia bacterium]